MGQLAVIGRQRRFHVNRASVDECPVVERRCAVEDAVVRQDVFDRTRAAALSI